MLAVGDAEFQRKCSEKIAELRRAGKTIVIVSHALGVGARLCDEVALLEHGELHHRRTRRPRSIDEYLGDVFADRVARRRLRGALGLRRGADRARSRCSTPTSDLHDTSAPVTR